jgi:major membrane immunogen (membrane-anchored lipoprotein)
MKKIVIVVVLVAALLTACGKSGGSMDHSTHNGMPGMDHGAGMATEANKDAAAGVKAIFKLSTEKPQPNQDTTITVNIQDKDGKPIDQFDVNHEKQMHIIVVSKDLSFFNHIHPENKGNGEFTVTTQFPAAGEYEVISDFIPTGIGAMSKTQWLTVQGNAAAPQPIEPDPSLTKVVDGKEVTLSFDHLMANMELELNFNIKDAKTGKPVTNLEPYLGAVGHVVILNQNAGEYLHVHPIEEKAKGPDAKFMATFPHSGVFKIWGQFQQNGKVFVVPFVVKVP